MPYMLKGNCVHKKNADGSPGKRMKCYDNVGDAKAYLGALEANVSDAKTSEAGQKVYRPFTQEETAYTTLHTNPGQACANCRFFKPSDWNGQPICHIVEPYPEPILATGWCNEWRVSQPYPEPEPIPVVIMDVDIEMDGEEAVGQLTAKPKTQAKGLGRLKNLLGNSGDPLVGFKISEDGKRWEALYSNNWRDDDGELFPEAAIDQFIREVKTGAAPWPELQYGHLSGLAHGVTDNLFRIGHHVLATGTFDETDLAAKLIAHGRKCIQDGRPLALSHRFWFHPKTRTSTGEYTDFETFEISWFEVLPGVKPANPFTVMEFKTMNSNIPPALVTNLESILGKQRAQDLIALSMQRDEQALAERRDSKTQTPAQPVTPTPATPQAAGSPPPIDWEAKFADQSTRLERAATELITASKALKEVGEKTEVRLTALETDMKALKAGAAAASELAPPGTRNPAALLSTEHLVAKYLTQEEQKTADAGGLSLIEWASGMKVTDVQPTITPGGAS